MPVLSDGKLAGKEKQKEGKNMIPNNKTARFAGLLFLLMVVSGLFAEIFFRQKIFVANDMAATAANISANLFLYRAGIFSDILMSVSYLLTALALYRLLVPVNKNLASLMVLFAAAGSVLLLSNILNELAPLSMIATGSQADAFTDKQLQLMLLLSFNAYNHGYMIGQVFFALWVLPLGLLIYRSKFLPRVFGVLFLVEVVCGLLSVLVHFMLPNETAESALLIPGTVAELSFMFWLMIRGISETKVQAQQGLARAGSTGRGL
jgi:hypothetical protein